MHSHPYHLLVPNGPFCDDLRPLARAIPLCSVESRAANLRSGLRLSPYKPAAFSSTYSRILVRASGGSSGAASIRWMIDAERPEALWLALRMVQAVLRESPSALACPSSVRNPAGLTASASSLILEACRAFMLAVSGSGRWVRACTRAAEDGRNTSDECDSMY